LARGKSSKSTKTNTPETPARLSGSKTNRRRQQRRQSVASENWQSGESSRPIQRARRFVRLEGVAEGNAQLRVGTTVSVSGLSGRWDNSYYVVEARHLYDVHAGYRTEFVGECAWLGDG